VMHSTAWGATCTACTVKHVNGLQAVRDVSAMYCGIFVCLLVCIQHPGRVDPDAVGFGGIGVLNFGGNRRREEAVLGGGKFGTFHCNQWDYLREKQ